MKKTLASFFVMMSILATGCEAPTIKGPEGKAGLDGKNGASAGFVSRTATLAECLNGGVAIDNWSDIDSDGKFDVTIDKNFKTAVICNGMNGITIRTLKRTPSTQECANGGTAIDVWSDVNNNLVYDTGVDTGFSTIVACNGTTSDGIISSGMIGPEIKNKSFSACRHDYLYLQNGWLLLRHQANGTLDQGVGSTGFNVWNVDIADFQLVSEDFKVTFCSVHFDKSKKTLTYTVEDNVDGLKGTTGTISL